MPKLHWIIVPLLVTLIVSAVVAAPVALLAIFTAPIQIKLARAFLNSLGVLPT